MPIDRNQREIFHEVNCKNCKNRYTYSCKYVLNIVDFKNVPEFISLNVPYTDFPTLVCVENNIIKYHESGTMTMKHLKEVLKDINFI